MQPRGVVVPFLIAPTRRSIPLGIFYISHLKTFLSFKFLTTAYLLKMHSLLVFLVIFSQSWALQVSDPINVTISAGTVQGALCPNSGASAFLSIPYAQPPIGDLRFASPQPYSEKYPSGTYDATAPSPACIQFGNTFLELETASEDW